MRFAGGASYAHILVKQIDRVRSGYGTNDFIRVTRPQVEFLSKPCFLANGHNVIDTNANLRYSLDPDMVRVSYISQL